MRYRQLGAIVLFFFFVNTKAQDIKLCFQSGYGFYNMSTLKDITQKALRQLPFDAKIISNYPQYIYYQPMIKIANKNFEYGFQYLFQTTGSRISSKDYSGEYRFDTKINCNSPGVILSGVIKDFRILKVGLSINAGMNFSTLKINEYLQIDSLTNNSNYKFTANSAYIEPAIFLRYVLNKLSLELNMGYFKEMFRKDFSSNKAGQGQIPVMQSFGDTDMWDGSRIGVTISYTILKQ